jgi:negative regulator of genetic competence, sporulation and motility
MDVDGEEVNVFNGAKSLIDLAKTTFIIEVHPKDLKERGQNIDQVLNFFSDEKFKKEIFRHIVDELVSSQS